MEQFADELKTHGLDVQVEAGESADATLRVLHGDEIDFQYSVTGRLHRKPQRVVAGDMGDDEHIYFRAEVQLNEGSQDYDVMGWTQKQVLHDIVEQYEKHLHFLHVLR